MILFDHDLAYELVKQALIELMIFLFKKTSKFIDRLKLILYRIFKQNLPLDRKDWISILLFVW